jgi:hypothetical protein
MRPSGDIQCPQPESQIKWTTGAASNGNVTVLAGAYCPLPEFQVKWITGTAPNGNVVVLAECTVRCQSLRLNEQREPLQPVIVLAGVYCP